MKPLTFGCLFSVLLVSVSVFWLVRLDTSRTQTAQVNSLIASPEMPPQSAPRSKLDLPAGTVVSVTLADPINSDHDPYWKQYAASVKVIEGHAIAPRSRATVRLVQNNTGWLTQLTELTIKGRKFEVLSSAGSVVGAQQDGKASPSPGTLERLGIAPTTKPASDQPVLLSPGTELRFVLLGRTTAGPRQTPAARTATVPGLSPPASIAASLQEPTTAYLCSASDRPDRDFPAFYYVALVSRLSDSQALAEKRWHEFLVATFHYQFAEKPHATTQCHPMMDPAAALNGRRGGKEN